MEESLLVGCWDRRHWLGLVFPPHKRWVLGRGEKLCRATPAKAGRGAQPLLGSVAEGARDGM